MVHLLAGGAVGRVAGIVMLLVFTGYLTVSIKAAGKYRDTAALDPAVEPAHGMDTLWIAGSLAGVAVGAHYFNLGANGMAHVLGVSDGVIGLSLVALGTSLPEVVTTIAAARQGQPELAIGNVAGSNLFNLMFVLPVAMLAKPLDIEPAMRHFDVPAMCLFAALAFPWPGKHRVIGRTHGLLLVALYVGYQVLIFSQGRMPSAP
jgi:cation:H+ antiporter